MSDPFEIENKFQKLKQILNLTTSTRLKLLNIINFIEPFLEEKKHYTLTAYLEELIVYFEITEKVDFTGTNLLYLARIKNTLDTLSIYYLLFSESEVIKNSINHINNEKEKITEWINRRKEIESFGLKTKLKNKRIDSTTINAVWIPLVEREQLIAEFKPHFATIKKLRVDVSFSNKKGEDELIIPGYIDSVHHNHKELEVSLTSAKNLFKRLTGIEIKNRLIVYCNFDDAYTLIGESLEAGLTSVIFCELLRLHQNKEEFILRNNVAITGKIDQTGKLFPVDEDGLRLKVEACYFSFIRYLIVPKEQEELCKTYISETLNHYNLPAIEIIGANKIEEVFINRKYTDLYHVPLIKQSARIVWKKRRPIAAVLFLIMALTIGRIIYGPVDKNPVSSKYEGKNLVLLNQFGEAVDKIKLMKESGDSTTVSLYDINNDGYQEIIWSDKPNNSSGSGEILICKDIITDKIKWKYNPYKKLEFPNNYAGEGGFNCTGIITDDFDNNGRPEVVAAFINGYFPTLVCKIDAVTGKEISWYINIGHIHLLNSADLDEDGIKEILLCGASNAFNCTCFIVLDPLLITGHSPLTNKYLVNNIDEGKEKFYILFPKTIIGETLSTIRNMPQGIAINRSEKNIRISIIENSISDKQISFFPNIGFDLKIKNVGTGDYYDKAADSLYDAGKIKTMPTPKYFKQEYIPKIQYWDGDKFVNKWVMNKSYLKVLKQSRVKN